MEFTAFDQLPFKPGDDLWWVSTEDKQVHCEEQGIKGIAIYADGVYIIDKCGEHWEPGTQWSFLTREDAEAFRAEHYK